MHLLSILLVLFVGGTCIGVAIFKACRAKAHVGWKRWLTVIGGIFVAVGGVGFFGTMLSALGGLRWLPTTFEWPAGFVKGILVMPDGKRVVPHTPSGRIQIYDSDWRFLRGWFVDAHGGEFKIRLEGKDKIEVTTARRQMRYVYTLDGLLLSKDTYTPSSYYDFSTSSQSAAVPTRFWLWTFSGPFHSWFVVMLGTVLLLLTDRTKLRGRKVG